MENWKKELKEEESFEKETLFHTISMTLVEGIKRLKLVPKGTFTIHLLGCSDIETNEPEKKYLKLFKYLKSFKELELLNLGLIGPRIPKLLNETSLILEGYNFKINIYHDESLYHDYYIKKNFIKPNLLL